MYLIIGGVAQGKSEYAAGKYAGCHELWDDFHESVLEFYRAGLSKEEIAAQVFKRDEALGGKLVVISNEIGMGIVPMEKEEREYRELTGRVLCLLAEKADSVERIICKIPMKIK